MDIEDVPHELLSPPEKRLVQTLITLKPKAKSLGLSLFVILFIVFITQFYWWNDIGVSSLLAANRLKIFEEGEYWRLFTAIFIHSDLGHLLSNIYMLGILSYFVIGYFGARLYFLWSLLGASFVNLLSIFTYSPRVWLLGASGWVYLLGGLWLTLYLFIQRQHSLSRRFLRVLGMGLMIFFPTSFEPAVSYRTHFFGFFVGVVIALIFFAINRNKIREYEKFQWVG